MFCLQGNKGDTSMFLEDVLPHLRDGGKVKINGRHSTTEYALDGLFILHKDILTSNDFVIANEPLKIECMGEKDHHRIRGDYFVVNLNPKQLYKLKEKTKYKVTIEEITE